MKILIIGDPHCHPEHDNNRLAALGKFIMKERPEAIVCMGDFADMPSLNTHQSKSGLSFEGLRYRADLHAVHDGMSQLMAPLIAFNKRKRKFKEKQFRPRMVMLMGNHEVRIDALVEQEPTLQGVISTDDLGYADAGWEEVPFKSSIEIEGINFSHYFASGLMGRPISGETIGKTLMHKLHTSAVVGHNHVYDHAERTKPSGDKLFGLSVGCFGHPEYRENWCANTVHLWWRGVVIIETDGDGYYDDFRAITQRKLMRDFL